MNAQTLHLTSHLGPSTGMMDTALLPNVVLSNTLKMVYNLSKSNIALLLYKDAPHKSRRDVSTVGRALFPRTIKLNPILFQETRAT